MNYKITIGLFLSIAASLSLLQAQSPERFRGEIRRFARLDSLQPPGENCILFTGSSSIRMWKSLKVDFPNKPVLNRGFGGSEMSDLLFYAKELIFQYHPAQIFIYEGDNDIAHKKSQETVMEETKQLMAKIHEKWPEMSVVLMAAKPSISRWSLREKYVNYNQLLCEYACQTDDVDYVDVWTVLLDAAGELRRDLFLKDGLHLNEKGYKIWTERIGKFVKE